jgi:hypothetical protein
MYLIHVEHDVIAKSYMKMKKLNYFSCSVEGAQSENMKLKLKALRTIAASPGLLRNHLLEVQREFDACDERAKRSGRHEDLHRKYGAAIKSLLKEASDYGKMVVRMVQVQREQINKYWKSIREQRKTVKRGAPASLESVTVETMIQMMLRVIEDMREMIPQLTEPLVNRIQNTLRKLQERMYMFRQFANDACMPDA